MKRSATHATAGKGSAEPSARRSGRHAAAPQRTGKRYRVCLVDDHPIVRRGMAQLIDQEPDLMVCGEADDAEHACRLIEKERPDLLIVDVSLQKTSGMDFARCVQARYPEIPVLILSMHEESLYAERALRSGARGYVMKAEAPETLLKAVREVLNGGIYVSDSIASRLLSRLIGNGSARKPKWGVESLSNREMEAFELIGRGLNTREIAERMSIGVKTAETYRVNIREKLGMKSSLAVIQRAMQWVGERDAR